VQLPASDIQLANPSQYMQIEVRRAIADDASPACIVLRRSIVECCSEDHDADAGILAGWLRNKTPETVRGWLLSDRHFAVVALADGEHVGFLMASWSGAVLLCYLVPEVRFAGVGKAMLAAIEQRARDAGIESLQLNSTRTARAFYSRNGFISSGGPVAAFGMESYPMVKPLTRTLAGDAP
jgi:GNAT superfamily N-acetyltransferase